MPESVDLPKGRMRVLQGVNGSTLVDDSYNSSPDAVVSAFDAMKGLRISGRKILALGDMMELGQYSAEEHRRIGSETKTVLGMSGMLITVGQRSRLVAEEAIRSGVMPELVKSFDRSSEAAQFLSSIVSRGDVVLVKGSQSVRTERITAALLREPQKAGILLVRQEPEWLAKP